MDTKKIMLMFGIVLLFFVVIVFAVAPDQPVLNSPTNNSVIYGNQATLNITVTDSDSDYLNVSFYGSNINGNISNWCYQETANISTTCGGLNTGSYYLPMNYFYVNYTKPTGVSKLSSWLVKHGSLSAYNVSIPSDCWSYDSSKLILRIESDFEFHVHGNSTPSCYNGSWKEIGTNSYQACGDAAYGGTAGYESETYDGNWATPAGEIGAIGPGWRNSLTSCGVKAYIYEEAMWWTIKIANSTNIVNNSYANYTWTDLANGDYEWYTTITDGTDTTTSPIYAFSIYDYNYTVNHTTPVLETSSQTFTLNITRDPSYIDDGNATLHWNGTDYSIDAVVYDTYLLFSKTLTIPAVGSNTNITLNWSYEFWNPSNTSTETNRTEDFTQLIYNIDMDDCSTYSIVALNFSLIEESNNASISGDMDFTFSLAAEGLTINYSNSVTGVNSTAFCIPTNDVSFTAQLQSEYSAGSYDAHTYFAYNLAVTNATQYIYYYLTNGTTIVEFTVLDQNGDKVEDAYIKVKKYDIGTGTYKTIEVLKTDQQGKALGNIILDTTWYEFSVEYGGTVYLNDGPTKITLTSRTFRINLLSDFFARYTDVIYGITSSLNYTDATGNFRFTWSDPDGNYHYGCLKVTKETLAGNTLINETCVESTAGTILVNINSSGSVNGTYVAVGYIKFDDPYVLQVLRKTWGSLSETFGSEGLFYAFLIILTVSMVGIFAPKVAVILAVIGLIFSSMLGFFNMNPSWIVALVIAAGLTIYRMRDN